VVQDAVADRTQEIHEANLFDLGAKYSQVVSEADAVRYLEGDR
jgi:maleamate amidohydrolase